MSIYIEKLFDGGKLNKNKIKSEWIQNNIPEYYKSIVEFSENITFKPVKYSQLIFHYENGLLEYPKCNLCGNSNTRFIGYESGYKLGCSRHCAILLTRPSSNETRRINTLNKFGVEHTTQLKSVRDKMKKTNLLKFGVEHPSQNKEVKKKIKETNNKKYGCDLPLQNVNIKDKMIKNFIEKWGFDNPIKSNIVVDKMKNNNLIKYGVEWHISSNLIKNKIKESNQKIIFDNIIKNYGDIKSLSLISYANNLIKFSCNKCNNEFEITSSLLYQRHIKNEIEICLICNPLNNRTSNGEVEIVDFIKELGIDNVIVNNRKLIPPYEIDIYLPDYKLGIEFNGIYWHSEVIKPDKKYHHNKSEMANRSGICLIQIWEDDWKYKRDIIKSIIRNKISKSFTSIGARNCKIKLVSNEDSKIFLNNNHLQGWSISQIRYGLYYNNELVSLMTLSSGRKNINNKNEWEIVRFCNKLNTRVIGSLSRLWSQFIKYKSPDIVISYSDNDIFNGSSYKEIGMEFKSESINYWWCDGDRKYNRWGFRKDKLVREGFDVNKTELMIMNERGWFRCWGSGTKKWIYLSKNG